MFPALFILKKKNRHFSMRINAGCDFELEVKELVCWEVYIRAFPQWKLLIVEFLPNLCCLNIIIFFKNCQPLAVFLVFDNGYFCVKLELNRIFCHPERNKVKSRDPFCLGRTINKKESDSSIPLRSSRNDKVIMKNFWEKLKKTGKPIIALAPMADITDASFRYICEKNGASLIYNEMVNVDAICHGSEKTLGMLKSYKRSRPFIVQLFGNKPENFAQATKIIDKRFKPDGFDINFGCPAPKVLKNKCGAELFQDFELSKKVIGAVLGATDKPVSVKTRIKAGKIDILTWLKYMKDLPISAIMVHARKLSQGLSGEVNLDVLKKVKEYFPGIVLGNGGINKWQDAYKIIDKTGVDGVGIAQGSLGRPWIFEEIKKKKNCPKSREKIFKMILSHANLYRHLEGDNLLPMRKHLCWYANGLPNAKKLRTEFVKVNTYKDIKDIIKLNA